LNDANILLETQKNEVRRLVEITHRGGATPALPSEASDFTDEGLVAAAGADASTSGVTLTASTAAVSDTLFASTSVQLG
jgi:hypothetical protein